MEQEVWRCHVGADRNGRLGCSERFWINSRGKLLSGHGS